MKSENILSALSDAELTNELTVLRSKEKELTLEILDYLIEVENRKLFVELGYGSMFDLCIRKLGYSESAALRRLNAALSD